AQIARWIGLQKAKELNDAFLLKLGWMILKAPDKLWVRVLTSKYLKESDQGFTIRRANWGSRLWRGIRRVWLVLRQSSQTSVRNGMGTSFWLDSWLESGLVLADAALHDLDDTGWMILKAPDKLWVRVLTSKYLKESDQGFTIRRANWGSRLWRGIRRVLPVLRQSCQTSVRNGMGTSFWLDSRLVLADAALHDLDDKLRGAEIGLHIAWDLGYRKVILELDSSSVVASISGTTSEDTRHGQIIHQIRELQNRRWQVKVQHSFRETNQVVDLLAHFGHGQPYETHFIRVLPSNVLAALQSDCIGVAFPT
ncbi:hypothetical protein LINPERHAP2_LOCUS32707, partial [Linum perenne]